MDNSDLNSKTSVFLPVPSSVTVEIESLLDALKHHASLGGVDFNVEDSESTHGIMLRSVPHSIAYQEVTEEWTIAIVVIGDYGTRHVLAYRDAKFGAMQCDLTQFAYLRVDLEFDPSDIEPDQKRENIRVELLHNILVEQGDDDLCVFDHLALLTRLKSHQESFQIIYPSSI